MINNLITINEKYLELYKNNPNNLKKHQLIKEILTKDNCFLNMDIEYAYSILRDLNIPEDNLKQTYLQLIDINKR